MKHESQVYSLLTNAQFLTVIFEQNWTFYQHVCVCVMRLRNFNKPSGTLFITTKFSQNTLEPKTV